MAFKIIRQEALKTVERDYYFEVIEDAAGGIEIRATDENGKILNDGRILNLNKDGLFLFAGVTLRAGIELDGTEEVCIRTIL